MTHTNLVCRFPKHKLAQLTPDLSAQAPKAPKHLSLHQRKCQESAWEAQFFVVHYTCSGREALFDEELGEEEVEEELAPLSAQLAYVLGRSGRAGDAGEVYDKLIRGCAAQGCCVVGFQHVA